MRRYLPFTLVALAIVAGLGWFSFSLAKFVMRSKLKSQLVSQGVYYTPEGDDVAGVNAQVEEARKAYNEFKDPEFGVALLSALQWQAYMQPEQADDVLLEALPLALKLQREPIDEYSDMQWMLTWCYGAAGLPSEIDRLFTQEGSSGDPSMTMYMWSRSLVSMDRLDRALQLLEQQSPGMGDEAAAGRAASYFQLGEAEKVEPLETAIQNAYYIETNIRSSIASYYLYKGDWTAALNHLEHVEMELPGDADTMQSKAIALMALSGPTSPEVAQALTEATHTPRETRSYEEARANAYAHLASIAAGEWCWPKLQRLADAEPGDPGVQLERAGCALSLAKPAAWLDDYLVELRKAHPVKVTIEEAQGYCSAAAAGAVDDVDRQRAVLLLGCALLLTEDGSPAGKAACDHSLELLLDALNDPLAKQPIVSEQQPGYEAYLLSSGVMEARAAYPEFDQAVHRAVIDYLNRRIDKYAARTGLQPLSYERVPAG
jgi:hypothetical protein